MAKREFLMLAKEYEPKKHDVSGWFMSEKLDGQRAFWDGGISRGMLARDVPYANTAKDGRYVKAPIATGLWSRYGKVIHAPASWLDGLPPGILLDMELWTGRKQHQLLRTIVSTLDPGSGWDRVTGYVLDSPGWAQVLTQGELTGTNFKGYLDPSLLEWVRNRSPGGIEWKGLGPFDEATRKLSTLSMGRSVVWHAQQRLPNHPVDARKMVEEEIERVTLAGGEGLILRRSRSTWAPYRTPDLLKVKKLHDMEGTVIGFTWGRKTELGSKLLGKMGALILRLDSGKRLELSGFTDDERTVVSTTSDVTYIDGILAEGHFKEGQEASDLVECAHFPRGSRVTFTYRELSDDGIPKEARYLRKRGSE